jgi:endonuclease YncB( thermonuclease family)
MRFLSIRKPRSARRAGRSRGRGKRFGNLVATLVLFGICVFLIVRLDTIGMGTETGFAQVQDGDTLTVNGERIRLSGIDAFELDQSCTRNGMDYSCGEAGKALLVRLTQGRQVRCEGNRRDRYRRFLAVCMAGDTELSRELVSAGWAVSYGAYRLDEIAARLNDRGAWEGDFVAPAVWRASEGRPNEPRHDIVSRFFDTIRHYLFGH